MEIKGVSLDDFVRIVSQVSREQYAGNLKVNDDAHSLRGHVRARLVARDGRRYGARRSASGRHGPYASWEAYRDVLAAVFDEFPTARIRTSLANYVGRAGFQELYPATAYHNVGSMVRPMTMPDLTVYPEAVDIMPITRDESARLAALAAARLAENRQYREQWGERNPEPRGPAWYTENDADRGVRPAENAANPGMIALREYVAAHPENWVAADRAARLAQDATDDAEDQRADRAVEARYNSTKIDMVEEIDKLLAEVAEAGWTSPYTDPDSPARKLA